jgi:hypothetical protein
MPKLARLKSEVLSMLRKYALLLILIIGLLAGTSLASRLMAQPGSESDPAVSLSYFKAATSLAPAIVEGGEELPVKPGKNVVLLEGKAKLTPPDNKSWIVDVRTGNVSHESVEMTVGDLYILIAGKSASKFMLQAWTNSTIALPGGSGE